MKKSPALYRRLFLFGAGVGSTLLSLARRLLEFGSGVASTLWGLGCRLLLFAAVAVLGLLLVAVIRLHPFLVLPLAAAWAWKQRHRFGGGWVHGTARLAEWRDVIRHRLAGDDGLIVGNAGYLDRPSFPFAFRRLLTAPPGQSATAVRMFLASFLGSRWCGNQAIRVRDYVHLATFGRAGSGKGVSVIIPNLLSYRGSTVVLDPKEENFRITADHRKRRFNHRIVKLSAFGHGSDSLNPIDPDLIDPTAPDFIDQCRDVAAAVVVRSGKETDNYWNDMSEIFITGIIAYVCACCSRREHIHLQTVRQILSNPKMFAEAVALMQETDAGNGMVRRLGGSMALVKDRELSSILATVTRHTSFLDSASIAATMLKSDFSPRDLRNGRMTLYLCLAPERLRTHAAVQRLWVSSIIRAVSRGGSERTPVLFLLDEIGNCGHLQILEDAVCLMRGMGLRLWFFFQSLGQVKQCFGDGATTFLDNIGTQQYFCVSSYETAEAISRRVGTTTVTTHSTQDGDNSSHNNGGQPGGQASSSTGRSGSVTVSEISRKLLFADEIMTLPRDMALVFHENMSVLSTKLIRYYNAPEFRPFGRICFLLRDLAAGLAAAAVLAMSLGLVTLASSLPTPAAPRYGDDRSLPPEPPQAWSDGRLPAAPPATWSGGRQPAGRMPYPYQRRFAVPNGGYRRVPDDFSFDE